MIQHNQEPSTEGIAIAKLLLNTKETAHMLGFSERYVRKLANEGKLPCLRFGEGKRQSVRFDPRALLKWVDDQAAQQNE
jgi:excisionase family DNA binding protein